LDSSGNDIYNTNTGNVGIGETDTDEKLHIKTSAGILAGIKIESPDRTSHIHFNGTTQDYSMGKYESGNDKFYIADSTAGGVNRFIITPSGNVGIGRRRLKRCLI